ncbi:hypothetical protein [Actinomyces bouchesdurhonensis]|uniref:hypothetical protein n=1 Tax=Actinomyces bouchesdurhonensis TaxID=1852361 RepID=UPI0028E599ED|nr:hypothetical protein [Actinomyces bouchesdurhonensis]
MSTLPGNPAALKTKVEGLITSANSIQSAIDGLSKFVTTSNSLAVAATYGQVKNAKKNLEAAHGRYLNTGLALREYQTVLADCHKRADAAAARGETAKRQHSAAQESVKITKRQLEALKDSHAPSTNVTNAQNAYKQACANEKRAAGAMTGAASDIKKEQMIVDAVANATISKIDTAISNTNDNLIDKISQFIKNVGKALAEISNWVKTLKDLVNTLKDIIYKTAILIFQCLVTAILVLGVFLIGLVLYSLAPLLGIIICSIAVLILAITLAAMGEKALIAAHNTALDAVEREHGPANVHDGDNGETTETVNTRPGKEGLIRDKMDLAGRPHPRGDWKEPPGWHEVGPAELRKLGIDPALLEDTNTGFHATLFRDDNGRYVLSYEGTNVHDLKGDVLTDAMGAVATSPQVHQAILAATTVKQRLTANGVTAGNFSLTGHSLGGELAAVGSIATGAKATTFNAAGVSFTSMATAMYAAKTNGYDTNPTNAYARVENYHFTTDPLTFAQTALPLPPAFGKQVEIKASGDDLVHFYDLNRGHGLDAMKRQYDAEHGNAYNRRIDRVDDIDPLRNLA